MTYKKANLEVVEFNTEDIITTSSGADTIPNQPDYTNNPSEYPDNFGDDE